MSSILSRRRMIAGVLGMPVVSSPAANLGIDSALLQRCNEFRGLAAEFERIIELPAGADPGYRALQRVMWLMEGIEVPITETPANTFAGLKAKAEIAKWVRQGNCHVDNDACLDERMTWSIVRALCT